MRIIKPFVSINGTEVQCLASTANVEPGDNYTFCKRDWSASFDMLLTYGADGSHTLLSGLVDQVATIVVRPSDAVVSVDNPQMTFDAIIPAVPFVSGATKGERQVFTLELMAEDEPVIVTV